jgi:hypothetical protein
MSVDPREAARFGIFDDYPVTDPSRDLTVNDLREAPNVAAYHRDPLSATYYSPYAPTTSTQQAAIIFHYQPL